MKENSSEIPRIALIGFGEAAHAISAHWTHDAETPVLAYDCALAGEAGNGPIHSRCREAGVTAKVSPAEVLDAAGLVFCLVTADQALQAAREHAPYLAAGCLWLDGNSCAPQTKMKAAEIIEAVGGHYIDMAIMAPVYPKRHEVPVLLAGPQAKRAESLLLKLGMRPKIAGTKVGDASSIKMLRSVMIKGLEALTAECLLAARRAGVEDAVIASLQASDPGIDWRARGSYNLERMLVHGARRAAEMEEVCVTLEGLGLPNWISRGTIEWQRRLSSLHLEPGDDAFAERADRVLRNL